MGSVSLVRTARLLLLLACCASEIACASSFGARKALGPVPVLMKSWRWVAVATASEALNLRRVGIDARLLVMGAISDDELPLALECGVPDAVCHIIAAHAAEGDLVKRTTEAFIVHHADFMAFLPFKKPKNVKVPV